MHIPHIAYVDNIVEIKEKSVVVSVSMDNTTEVWEVDYPCLITVDKGIFTPRLPSYKRGKEIQKDQITVYTFKDLEDQDESHYGLKGSPTQVERMFPPLKNNDKEMWEDHEEILASKMFEKMKEIKVL